MNYFNLVLVHREVALPEPQREKTNIVILLREDRLMLNMPHEFCFFKTSFEAIFNLVYDGLVGNERLFQLLQVFDKHTRVMRKISELNLGFSDLTTKYMLKDEFSESLFQVCFQSPFEYVVVTMNEIETKERWVDSTCMRLSMTNDNEISFFEGNTAKEKIKYLNHFVATSVYRDIFAVQGNVLVLRNCRPDLYSQAFDYVMSFLASFTMLYFIRKGTDRTRHQKNSEPALCVVCIDQDPTEGSENGSFWLRHMVFSATMQEIDGPTPNSRLIAPHIESSLH